MNTLSLRLQSGCLAAALLLTLLTVSCDSTDANDDPTDGLSDFTVSGGVDGRFVGNAFFASSADAGDQTPGIALALYRIRAQDTTVVIFASEGSNERPSPNDYQITFPDTTGSNPLEPDEYVALFFRTSPTDASVAVAETGVLRILTSSDGKLEGTFWFEGEGIEGSTSMPSILEIEMTGSFTAMHATGDRLHQLIEELGLEDLDEVALVKRILRANE